MRMEIATSHEFQTLKSNDSKLFDINRGVGIMWMMVSALMTTVMNVIIKTTIKDVNVQQAAIIRAVFLALGCFMHLKIDRTSIFSVPPHLYKIMLLRALFGFCAVIGLYMALEELSMSEAVSLYFTSPIITAILCYFALGEKLSRFEILGIFSSMFGVVLLTQPYLFDEANAYPRMISAAKD